MSPDIERELPDNATKFLEQMLDSSLVEGNPITFYTHNNRSKIIYQLASEGKAFLFYGPTQLIPMVVGGNSMTIFHPDSSNDQNVVDYTEVQNIPFEINRWRKILDLNTWRQKRSVKKGDPQMVLYFVPPETALKVGEMINDSESPKTIIDYLGEANKVISKEQKELKVAQYSQSAPFH